MKANAKNIFAKSAAVTAVASGVTFAFPALAFASEEEAGGINALLPNMAEFVPMLVCFLLLIFILGKFGWPKFAEMLDNREQTIKDSLEKSEAARIESEKLLEEYKKQLAEAKTQAAQIVTEAKQTGEALKADMSEQAQKEAADIIAKAKAAIEVEKKVAISELQSSVADTSIAVASRLVGNDLSDDDHRKIVERYVKEAGNFNAN